MGIIKLIAKMFLIAALICACSPQTQPSVEEKPTWANIAVLSANKPSQTIAGFTENVQTVVLLSHITENSCDVDIYYYPYPTRVVNLKGSNISQIMYREEGYIGFLDHHGHNYRFYCTGWNAVIQQMENTK